MSWIHRILECAFKGDELRQHAELIENIDVRYQDQEARLSKLEAGLSNLNRRLTATIRTIPTDYTE